MLIDFKLIPPNIVKLTSSEIDGVIVYSNIKKTTLKDWKSEENIIFTNVIMLRYLHLRQVANSFDLFLLHKNFSPCDF